MITTHSTPSTLSTKQRIENFVDEVAALTRPSQIYWCNGSQDEYDRLCADLVQNGTFTRLSTSLRPNSYLARTNPADVARVEERTFICSQTEALAGPTNHWHEPVAMQERLKSLFAGCMQGRTLYVVPFCMGPLGSPHAIYGIEITDSAYVAVSMGIMTRMGIPALEAMEKASSFVPCVHSVGYPLAPGTKDVAWPCDPAKTLIAHFPDDRSIWSYGSGYGGNALLGKKCLALRIASVIGRDEGWLAEHMMISEFTHTNGQSMVVAAALPSACGKTNLAMITAPDALKQWKVSTLGDDIAWMHVDKNGSLRALNPEFGFFGVAPGTSLKTNPVAMKTIEKNTIFTNVAMTPAGDVWWEGLTEEKPERLIDWHGQEWTPASVHPAAHPNSRFTAPLTQCPILNSNWNDPEGAVVDALLFGGRRSECYPLVMQSFSWEHGVTLASSLSSETTSANEGEAGVVRRDPFAMLPFCGYNMGDYFNHWLEIGRKLKKAPSIFIVNWFLKDQNKKFLWPGFSDNMRVIDWIYKREKLSAVAISSAVGWLPVASDFCLDGLSGETIANFGKLFRVDPVEWIKEADAQKEFHKLFGHTLPKEIEHQLHELDSRLFHSCLREKGEMVSSTVKNVSPKKDMFANRLRVRDFVKIGPVTIDAKSCLSDVISLMRDSSIRHLPVLSNRKIVGIVSDRDVKWGLSFGRPSQKILVEEVMSPEPYTVTPDADLEEIVFNMTDQKIGAAIVEDKDGYPVGIFTTIDALRVLMRLLGPAM